MPEPEAVPTLSPPTLADRARGDLHEVGQWADLAWSLLLTWGLRFLGVVLLLIAAWTLAGWARRRLYRALNRPRFDQTLIRFLSNFLRWAILGLGVVAALTVFGIAPSSLVAIVGAAGLAIGLAMQGSLSNLAAGIMLLILRPFEVGQTVVVAGQAGVVDEIELFYTRLDTPDRRRVLLPNSLVFGAIIENTSHHRTRRVDLPVGVAAGAEVERTRAALTGAARGVLRRLDEPAPEVALLGLGMGGAGGGGGVNWQVGVWCRAEDYGAVREDLIGRVIGALDGAGIGFALPRMEVRLPGNGPGEGRSGGEESATGTS